MGEAGYRIHRELIKNNIHSEFCTLFKLSNKEDDLLRIDIALYEINVFPRRYFYPSLNLFDRVVDIVEMPISEDISKGILCLPLYWKLSYETIENIITTFKTNL